MMKKEEINVEKEPMSKEEIEEDLKKTNTSCSTIKTCIISIYWRNRCW